MGRRGIAAPLHRRHLPRRAGPAAARVQRLLPAGREPQPHSQVPGQDAVLRRPAAPAGGTVQPRTGPGSDGRLQHFAEGSRYRHRCGKRQALAAQRQVQLPARGARVDGAPVRLGPGRQLPRPAPASERPLQLVRLPQPRLRGPAQARPAHRPDHDLGRPDPAPQGSRHRLRPARHGKTLRPRAGVARADVTQFTLIPPPCNGTVIVLT
ncbi:hypothetical protein OF001_U30269 [Pseudomonas sp. OF001]|nr:hypothetical protein OF001_U30269 [Pseudomonas sp. OF001]